MWLKVLSRSELNYVKQVNVTCHCSENLIGGLYT